MGTLVYDGARVGFDDVTLAHLQIVIVRSVMRRESLLVSWHNPLSEGDGRAAMWISASLPVHFEFAEPQLPPIDQMWLERLTGSATGRTGLAVIDRDGNPVRPLHCTIVQH